MIQFDSRDKKFKSPYGAVPCGTAVSFRLLAQNCEEVFLITDVLGTFPMKKDGDFFTYTLTVTEAGLVHYCFRAHDMYGNTIWCGKGEGGKSACSATIPPFYQLTVFEQTPALPNWYQKGIVYQIFPDRFRVGGEVRRTKENAYYRAWNEQPAYIKDGGNIQKWDFYGGNLQGITEKLPYLKSLGVTAIYLNPIFKSMSNHRYSTADFRHIDEMLGSLDDFKTLIDEAEKQGIKLILDGVFNHVGADSVYFNKFGTFGTDGAYKNPDSKYRSWFRFRNYPNEYDCWWGVSDLPDLNTENADLRDYLISGENSIIKYWTRLGIGGWRLDVADELPDDFLALLYKTVKANSDNAIVMGEVWEDASNKIAYDKLKKYFTNRELDCVMNYPLRDNLLAFFSGEISAETLAERFETLRENYPKSAFYGGLNLLGTHDVERIFTKAQDILPENPLALLTQLVALQFAFPGVPCIYYGDEAGLTGGKDPDNRKPYPWGNENEQVMAIYKTYTAKRAESPILQSGETEFLAIGEDVFGVKRYMDGKTYTILVNRSGETKENVPPHGIKEE